MARKSNEIISTANDRTQSLEHMKAVELVPTSKTAASTAVASYITVRIANCSMRITDNTDLNLLKKISEAFDHD